MGQVVGVPGAVISALVLVSGTNFGDVSHNAGNEGKSGAGELGLTRRRLNEFMEEEVAARRRRRRRCEANDDDVAREERERRWTAGGDAGESGKRGRSGLGSAAGRRSEDLESDAAALLQ